MRRYTIQVNGSVHTLDVEETARDRFSVTFEDGTHVDAVLEGDQDLAHALVTPGVERSPARPAIVASAPRPVKPAASSPAPVSSINTAAASSSAGSVTAPLPGVILSVAVAPGASVARGEVLLILEAMKMKNEIRSERDGVVATVHVQAGDQVKHGDALISFEG